VQDEAARVHIIALQAFVKPRGANETLFECAYSVGKTSRRPKFLTIKKYKLKTTDEDGMEVEEVRAGEGLFFILFYFILFYFILKNDCKRLSAFHWLFLCLHLI
jgi:hypothetical protein